MRLSEAAAMARKLSLTGTLAGEPSRHDSEHFYRCQACGQMVDMRQLGEVLHHEIPGHKPLPGN